jgi:hypothetical protein
MTGHGSKLDRKQEQAIAALLAEPSILAAAAAAGVGEKTLRRWLEVPEFAEAYRQARRNAVSQATARLQAAMGEAADTLRSVMNDPEASALCRIGAARAIWALGVRGMEVEDLAAQVEELQRDLSGLRKVEEEQDVKRNGRHSAWR